FDIQEQKETESDVLLEEILCINCKKPMKGDDKKWYCECGMTVWKVTSGKLLSPVHLKQLMEQGQTEILKFISKKNKPFKTRLAVNDTRVEFDFDTGSGEGDESSRYMALDRKEIRVRVESAQPGIVDLTIESIDMPRFFQRINFGLGSTREAECMGIIVAADYARFYIPEYGEKTMRIQVNSEEFSSYILRETKPRDKEMQFLIQFAWKKLNEFRAFEAVYTPKRRRKTDGGNVSRKFPFGIFPWLEKVIESQGQEENIRVFLPHNPAVYRQFKASFHVAQLLEVDDDEYLIYEVPIELERALDTWFSMVAGSTSDTIKINTESEGSKTNEAKYPAE
ncbi:topoisomerase-like protein, partial [Ruminiclostridium sufflavum DSM 19573]